MSIDNVVPYPSNQTPSNASQALMEHLFSLRSLPQQHHIDELAGISLSIRSLDQLNQLAVLRETAERQQLFEHFESSSWFVQEGGDYLYRPELLRSAPLTKVVLLLKETLTYRNWNDLLRLAHPHYLSQLLERLRDFSESKHTA
ncbi:hypothetical protein OAG1_04310 [Agarivorans sp. OAG1]|uniref:Uncharacterized protein n=1 Tax=Agarivorans albus MKT 106 TaxID=1331007 RepID=R9PLW2_AGAAL|nr:MULTISPECIES: hypothetical protein [Agarivorans]MPW31568.1 hypothetical protein [Agarivorans sp. B2Z047]UQN42611.1 hypothetical protein LQZ07_22995 [Agarivorans sp. B2Z047]BEU01631.1 hypothetical protein OAG1_04310 [Agarivorans sp. OAG1]GAD02334.1 hypothetical protein AALB_2414 [Agarivorans albus MKT 106]